MSPGAKTTLDSSPLDSSPLDSSHWEGLRIDGFRILRVLASGGMGHVFEARQENPSRAVALKLLRPEVASRSLLARFEHEAQILGRLTHPSIARIYASGTTDVGFGEQPWIALELVEGAAPITGYAARAKLDTRARLRLLAAVCRAVNHAHLCGVVHRDLKPENVLVDREGRPRLVDFGIARLVDEELRRRTRATAEGQLLGTLPYMSPEQVAGDPDGIDYRADVYALGVLAYELLTGRLPLDVGGRPLTEALAVIRHRAPAPLGRIDDSLQGDVETIVGRALEKEPDRRYSSAGELADDVDRHLADEPIRARPASRVYLLRKFARRNRTAVSLVAALIAVLVSSAAVAAWLAWRATHAEGEAEARAEEARSAAARAEAVRDFLVDDLVASLYPEEEGPAVPLYDLLQRARPSLAARFEGQPLLEATVRHTLASMLHALGNEADARHEAERARALASATGEGDSEAGTRAEALLARIAIRDGHPGEAESLLRRVIEAETRHHGPVHWHVIGAELDLARALLHLARDGEALDLLSATRARALALGDEELSLAAASIQGLSLIHI